MFVELTRDYLGRKAGERIDLAEPDARRLVDLGTARHLDGDPLADAADRALDAAHGRLTATLERAVGDALGRFAQAQTLSRKGASRMIFGESGRAADADRLTFGDWLLCVRTGDARRLEDVYGSQFTQWQSKAAMHTGTGAQGGYTVPADFHSQLMAQVAEASVVRSRATVLPMGSRSMQVPALDVTTAPTAGDTAFLGGLVARWTEEATTLNETEPQFKQIELVAHELSGYAKVSNALLADNAVGLEALLRTLFAQAVAWYEDYGFLRGNGVGKPLGVLNAGALITVTRSGANAFALADVAGMLARLLPGWSPRNTVWAMHPTVLAKLLQIASTAAAGQNLFLDNLRDRPTMMVFGLPVEVTEKLPALGTTGDVLLMDLRHYLVGDRQQLEVAYSEHVAFTTNQGAWRFVSRVDGQPWMRSAVTLADASNTFSPFVCLS